jgi:hypothetical protein
MNEARYFTIAEFDMQPFLELADRFHPPVRLQQFVSAKLQHATGTSP